MYMEQKSGREREPMIKKYEIPIEVLMYLMRLDLAKKVFDDVGIGSFGLV